MGLPQFGSLLSFTVTMRRIKRVVYCILFSLGLIFISIPSTQAATNSVRFRTPQGVTYRVETAGAALRGSTKQVDWVKGWPEDGSTNYVQLGSRVVLQLKADQVL